MAGPPPASRLAATRGVIFDLDGTLVDSFTDITAAFCRSFAAVGRAAPAPDAVRPLMGLTLHDMYGRFVPPDLVEPLIAVYRADYAERCADDTRPFSGIVPLLERLRQAAVPRAVATTKSTRMARAVTDKLGLTILLDHVQGTDGFPHKPAPDVVQHAVAALRGAAEWMVGDSWLDITAGRAAGLRTCAVTWGVDDVDRLHAAGPDIIVETVEDLAAVLEGE
jgi:phosphoglycolate phosphatase